MNKKIILSIMLIIFALTLSTVLAVSGDIDNPEDIQYIDNYEDYEQLLNETSTGYSQEQLAEEYIAYQDYVRDYYNHYSRQETVKAKVIKSEEVEEKYEFNEYYYSISKYKVQPISVEVLEGTYAGQKFEIDYLLTGDSLNNVKYSELKKGDIVFVAINKDTETGMVYAEFTNAGSNIERFGVVICLGIIATLLIIIYGGKKGVLTVLIALMSFIFCLVIIPNMAYLGNGFIIGSIILILLLTALISLSEFGIKANALVASGISLALTVISVMLVLIANYLTRTVGITFETAAVSENVLLGNMNFTELYLVITAIISSVFLTNIVCKSIRKVDEAKEKGFNERLKLCREILTSNILGLVITVMALYIPNHLLLLTNKYTTTEIWNSEILVSELIRLFAIVSSMSLAIPTVAAIHENSEKAKKDVSKNN